MNAWILLLAGLMSQSAPVPDATIPDVWSPWAASSWQALEKTRSLRISKRLNPYVWRGDFDGDDRPDLALLVVDEASGKEGIAFLLHRGAPVVIGAGREFGNGGDDFSWIAVWSVEDRGTRHGNFRGEVVNLRADGLMVAREPAASALIHFSNGQPAWHAYGD